MSQICSSELAALIASERQRSKEEFLSDVDLYEATLRNIEIIGEAGKNVPLKVRELAPGIPWRLIARTRDVLAHVYFGVDDAIIWQIVSVNAPALIAPLERLLQEINEDGSA